MKKRQRQRKSKSAAAALARAPAATASADTSLNVEVDSMVEEEDVMLYDGTGIGKSLMLNQLEESPVIVNYMSPTTKNEIRMPGDEFIIPASGAIILGPGLQLKPSAIGETEQTTVKVTKAGMLVKQKPNKYFIDNTPRAYSPHQLDDIVGVILKRAGDEYVVDIGHRDRITLSKMGFEGATKKYRPDLRIGDIVFGRLMDTPVDFPFEITCVNSAGKSMGLGALENGFLFIVKPFVVRLLQTNKKQGGSDLLSKLGKIVPFEIAVGINGYVWVKSKNELTNVLIARTIKSISAPNLPSSQYEAMLSKFKNSLEKIQSLTD